MKWLKLSIINKIFDIFFILFVILCFFVVIVPLIFRVKFYVIASGSMKPEINIGDLVVSKKVDANKLKKGDIISYHRDDIIITHRIIRIEKETNEFVTKGDNNMYEDNSKVTADQISGRLVLIIPFLGYIYVFINQYSLFICIFILIFGCILKYLNGRGVKSGKRSS